MTESLFLPFLKKHLDRVQPLAKEAHLADWGLQTTGLTAARDRSIALNTELAKIYANPEEYAFLKSFKAGSLESPLIARQHKLLSDYYLSHQMEDSVLEEMIRLQIEIEENFNNHRAVVRGILLSDNEVDDILLESEDQSLRRETWLASKSVGRVVKDQLLELVRLRNREAKRLGFSDYYAMSLSLQELEEARLFSILNTLNTESEPSWNRFRSDLDNSLAKKFNCAPEDIRPWHHSNRFFQETGPGEADLNKYFLDNDLEALSAEFFAAIGLPIDDLLKRADLYERPGKCQHAFCMDIDRSGDIRVLCNNRANERWMGTMLHEFGHAVYDKFLDTDLPYLLRTPCHTLATESIALFMGRLSKNPDWLHRYAHVPLEEARQIAAAAQRELRENLLVFMHWCFVMVHFERELYRDPDQDLDTLWWDIVEKYQKVRRPDSRTAPDWASKIHLASSPVYYHNYQLGEMVASQLLHYLQTVVLEGEEASALVRSPKVGEYLKQKVFKTGALYEWETWLENATGEMLNPKYFVEHL